MVIIIKHAKMVGASLILMLSLNFTNCFAQVVNLYCDNNIHYEINAATKTITINGRDSYPVTITKDEFRFNLYNDPIERHLSKGVNLSFVFNRKLGVLTDKNNVRIADCERSAPLVNKF